MRTPLRCSFPTSTDTSSLHTVSPRFLRSLSVANELVLFRTGRAENDGNAMPGLPLSSGYPFSENHLLFIANVTVAESILHTDDLATPAVHNNIRSTAHALVDDKILWTTSARLR